ncbi:MAG: hypothetical protein AB1Z67_01390 [Candidatus Limnocylindrales bacterium]
MHQVSLSPSRLTTLALLVVFVLAAVGIAARPGLAAAPPARDEQLRFMWAMAGQESGWDYYARNASSGAFGKYQIMPFNWPAWAGKYLGDRHADQTPYNQEAVAFGKLRDLYVWLGSWKRVAYWWLTGSSEKNEKRWSAYATGYVKNIMALRKKAPSPQALPPKTSSRAVKGDWRRSGQEQRLRLKPGGAVWPERGELRDGQVLKVRATAKTGAGIRWIKVVTADGRLGWLKQIRTVPTHRPKSPSRWRDVKDRGESVDRQQVRPRPR